MDSELLTSGCKQVRHLVRPVSSEEYDFQIKRMPNLCLMSAFGDLRRWAELLDQIDADEQLWLNGLRGRRVEALILQLEQKRARLELVQRPIVRSAETCRPLANVCLGSSNPSIHGFPGWKATVPPPIGVAAGVFLSSSTEATFRQITHGISPLVAGWRGAYKMNELVQIFEPLPPAFKALLKRASETLQVLKKAQYHLVFRFSLTDLNA